MRIRIGHRPEDWLEHGPANGATGPSRPTGSLVQGLPGWKERRRSMGAGLTANQMIDPNVAASRRYRARHPERVAEYQRRYRARLRAERAA